MFVNQINSKFSLIIFSHEFNLSLSAGLLYWRGDGPGQACCYCFHFLAGPVFLDSLESGFL